MTTTTAETAESPLAVYTAEIERRGGETSIRNGKKSWRPLAITDEAGGLYLLHVTSWRYYSSRATPRLASLSYLCGTEDDQLWAVRVPGTITLVSTAIGWLEPAAVIRARVARRRVLRQGDLYAVETTPAHDGKGERPDRHAWDPAARTLSHPEHPALHLPWPVRFYPQRAYGMGRRPVRGPSRTYGD